MDPDTLRPEDLAALSIFPLPDATLFPGVPLPLHVFEPRYRALVRDALASSKVLAVARLKPGFESDYEKIRWICSDQSTNERCIYEREDPSIPLVDPTAPDDPIAGDATVEPQAILLEPAWDEVTGGGRWKAIRPRLAPGTADTSQSRTRRPKAGSRFRGAAIRRVPV